MFTHAHNPVSRRGRRLLSLALVIGAFTLGAGQMPTTAPLNAHPVSYTTTNACPPLIWIGTDKIPCDGYSGSGRFIDFVHPGLAVHGGHCFTGGWHQWSTDGKFNYKTAMTYRFCAPSGVDHETFWGPWRNQDQTLSSGAQICDSWYTPSQGQWTGVTCMNV